VFEYSKKLFSILGITLFIIIITNIFDTLAKFKSIEVSSINLINLIVYKAPYLISEISPIIAMLATLFFLSYLLKSNQITNIFNNGFSIIFIVKVVSFVNVIFGIVVLLFISTSGSVLVKKYEILEKKLNSGSSQFYSNLLIKDESSIVPRFIYIGRVNLKTNVLENAIVLTLKKNMFDNRLNCKEGVIADDFWQLSDCVQHTQDGSLEHKNYVLNTSLKVQDILNYSQQIYNVPFWSMPQIISSSEKLGMQTLLLELYYNKLLFRPIIIVLLGLMPFYFFKANKSKIWSNTIDTLVIGIVAFLCINIATNFLTQYIKSAIICNSLPVLCLAILIFARLKSSYKYPI